MRCAQDKEVSPRRWHLNKDLGVSEQAGLGACEGSESGGRKAQAEAAGGKGRAGGGGGQAGAPAAPPDKDASGGFEQSLPSSPWLLCRRGGSGGAVRDLGVTPPPGGSDLCAHGGEGEADGF